MKNKPTKNLAKKHIKKKKITKKKISIKSKKLKNFAQKMTPKTCYFCAKINEKNLKKVLTKCCSFAIL